MQRASDAVGLSATATDHHRRGWGRDGTGRDGWAGNQSVDDCSRYPVKRRWRLDKDEATVTTPTFIHHWLNSTAEAAAAAASVAVLQHRAGSRPNRQRSQKLFLIHRAVNLAHFLARSDFPAHPFPVSAETPAYTRLHTAECMPLPRHSEIGSTITAPQMFYILKTTVKAAVLLEIL